MDGDTRMTYAELDRRANGIAQRLRDGGTGHEDVVAVAIPRSADLIATQLGVLKAGAAFLPVDLDHPDDRVAYLLTDSRARVVITTAADVMRLPLVDDVSYLVTDDVTPVTTGPSVVTTGDHPAYLMYTSGTTGRPKGVLITHHALLNQLTWVIDHFGLRGDDRMLHQYSPGFDPHVEEVFAPLLAGAAIVVARPGGHTDPAYLTGLVRDERVTVMDLVPTLLRALLDHTDSDTAPWWGSLRRLLAGGEALTPELA
ncbi:MAG: AMP-binding protein, partial [Actinophytocola sp.]|nr:AMP-binding protein [Actinophytocola sp.]